MHEPHISFFFFFNDMATTEIYTLSLHDALPICQENYAGPGVSSVSHAVREHDAERQNAHRQLEDENHLLAGPHLLERHAFLLRLFHGQPPIPRRQCMTWRMLLPCAKLTAQEFGYAVAGCFSTCRIVPARMFLLYGLVI